jgi:hypothetical protein
MAKTGWSWSKMVENWLNTWLKTGRKLLQIQQIRFQMAQLLLQ